LIFKPESAIILVQVIQLSLPAYPSKGKSAIDLMYKDSLS